MDTGVSVVDAYLQTNGFFTVAEYQVIEALETGEYRTTTDLDVMAVRFPGAGRYVPGPSGSHRTLASPDPALGVSDDRIEFVIGEVKEGQAQLNRAARDPQVLRVALTRFGAVAQGESGEVVDELIEHGEAITPSGARVRLIAFGSKTARSTRSRYTVMSIGHIGRYLSRLMDEHWDAIRVMKLGNDVFALLALMEKAGRQEDDLDT